MRFIAPFFRRSQRLNPAIVLSLVLLVNLMFPQLSRGQSLANEKPGTAPNLVIDTQGFTTRVNSVDFSPAGDIVAGAGSDKVVRLWDVATGNLRATLRGYDDDAGNGQCMVVRFSPDGKSLVVGVQDFTDAGAVRVYRTDDPSEVQMLLPGHGSGGVANLAFSPDGRFLVTQGVDGTLIFWNWPTGTKIGQLQWTPQFAYLGFPTAIPLFVIYDATGFHAFSAPHASELAFLNGEQRDRLAPAAELNTAYTAASGLGALLGRIEDQSPSGGRRIINRFVRSKDPTREDMAIFSSIGRVDGNSVYTVTLWTLSGRQLRAYHRHDDLPSAVALSPDASLVASADDLGNIDLWEAATGKRRIRLEGKGSPVFSAAFDTTGARIAYGTKPFGPDRWKFNEFGEPDTVFDLHKRTFSKTIPTLHATPSLHEQSRQVQITLNDDKAYTFVSNRDNQPEGSYALSPGVIPQRVGYLTGKGTGIQNLLMIGCNDNALFGLDPTDTLRGRRFVGHTGAIYAFGESPDGKTLVSGSSDRTLKLWNLNTVDDLGWPDFDSYGNGRINYLKPGGNSERAGIRLGDIFVGLDGKSIGSIYDGLLAGKRDFRPGQRAKVNLTREGMPFDVTLELSRGGDFVIPMLNLFVAGDEWVLWTPSGYYDASPGGDRLIGWHVNRGRAKSALFYSAHQFRKQFFRPDVIDKIIEMGDAKKAVISANHDRPDAPPPLDLRNPDDFKKIEPPRVVITQPLGQIRTDNETVKIIADVTSMNGFPIGDIKVLVNGRSVTGKTVNPRQGDTDLQRHIEIDVPLNARRNAISIVANDLASKSSSEPRQVIVIREDADADLDDKPKVYVLAVGISKYQNAKFNLDFAHLDAASFAVAWTTQSGKLYSDVKTKVIVNEEASLAGIRSGFDWLGANVSPQDVAVLFVAAHGMGEPSKGYFIASHELDADRLSNTAISDRELISLAENLKSRHTLVFLDTCHAGGIEGGKKHSAESLRELVSDEVGAIMFGACKPRESSIEDPQLRHGIFTEAILEIFADPSKDLPPADGLLSIDELVFPLGRRVADLTHNQHTVVGRPSTIENFDFFSFTKPPAAPAPATRGTENPNR